MDGIEWNDREELEQELYGTIYDLNAEEDLGYTEDRLEEAAVNVAGVLYEHEVQPGRDEVEQWMEDINEIVVEGKEEKEDMPELMKLKAMDSYCEGKTNGMVELFDGP